MPLKKSQNTNLNIHGVNDKSVARALVWNRAWLTNQWLIVVLGVLGLGSIVFAYHSYAASTTRHHLKPYGVIDYPKLDTSLGTRHYLYFVRGWAVDTKNVKEGAVASVQMYIDKVDNHHYLGKAKMGLDRTGICGSFKGGTRVGCPNIGWNFWVDTKKHHISDGSHTIIAKIIDKDQDKHYYLAKNTLRVDSSYHPIPVTTNEPPAVVIQSISQAPKSNNVTVLGYAFDSLAHAETLVNDVDIYVDGVLKDAATLDIPFKAACDLYGYRPGCPNVGYTLTFDGTGLSGGPHTLKAKAFDVTRLSSEVDQVFNFTPYDPSFSPRSTVDRIPDEVSGGNLVHYIYMLPYDGVDRQFDQNSTIKTSIAAQQQWLAGQTGGRTLRVDTYGGGLPDISFFQPTNPTYTKAFYKNLVGDGVWKTVSAQVAAAGFSDPAKRYVVIFEGGNSYGCGVGGLGGVGLAMLDGTSGAFQCSLSSFTTNPAAPNPLDYIPLHELFHVLGTVPVCAKNNDATNPGHVTDSDNDIMHGVITGVATVLDFNHDDYYFVGGASGCTSLTLNLSHFLN